MLYIPIGVTAAHARLRDGWKPYVVDVRTPEEAALARLDFTDRLHPHDTILDIAEELPRDKDLLLYCRSGGRSARAATALAQVGFRRLYNLEGGINAWAEQIDPRLRPY